MKRSEAVILSSLFGVLLALGGFVGVQMLHAPRRATVEEGAGSFVTTRDEAGGGLASVRKSSLPRPPARDYEAISRLLAAGRDVTYIDAILAARDGNVARWVERRGDPVAVWIQPTTSLRNFRPEFRDRTRDAFYTWAASGLPMRFRFVDDSSLAEVHVVWVDRFDDAAAGKTFWARDRNWWIVGADIQLALRRPSGESYDQMMIRTIALHEVGHLLGLDHSPNADDIMSAKVHVTAPSTADVRTATLVYELPPGPVAKPPAP